MAITRYNSNDPAQNPTAGMQDAASQIVDQFLQLAGYPKNLVLDQMTHKPLQKSALVWWVLHTGAWNRPRDALQGLFNVAFTPELKAKSPWVQYGMDQNTYLDAAQLVKTTYFNQTGQTISDSMLHDAIQNHWSTSDIQQQIATNPDHNLPWTLDGTSYLQVREQYQGIYGKAPTDTSALANWYRFRQSSQMIRSSQPSPSTTLWESQPKPVKGADTAVR